jgi:D-arabinose 1-dehydrogenase-like Zn-dependent alcohol dehydrogenase
MYGFAEVDQGSLATYAVWKADFLFAIPDAIESEDAAPLMCGGATVFNALQLYGVRSTDRVGIVGVGGLGHLAIQFAAAMGCEVVVFSGTDSKKEESIKLGAKEFYATKGLKELNVEPLDHLLVCTSVQPDWSMYLPIMAPSGTVYPLSVSGGDLKLPYMPVLLAGLKIQGSLVAARQIHRQMLEFAAVHHIRPIIERFPMNVQGVEQAFKKLEEGNMRYRGVIAV